MPSSKRKSKAKKAEPAEREAARKLREENQAKAAQSKGEQRRKAQHERMQEVNAMTTDLADGVSEDVRKRARVDYVQGMGEVLQAECEGCGGKRIANGDGVHCVACGAG